MDEAEQPQGGCDDRAAEGAARFAALTGPDANLDWDEFLDEIDLLTGDDELNAVEAEQRAMPLFREIDGEPVPAPEQGIDRLLASTERAAARAAAAMAEQLAGIGAIIRQACRSPEVFLGPHAGSLGRREAVEFARRAAVAELATRLHVSENTIHTHAATADTLRRQLPAGWAAFRDGSIGFGKVQVIAEQARTLTGRISGAAMAELDVTLLAAAARVTPAKLRQKARLLHERLHPEPATERHARARTDRGVWVQADLDGMAWLNAHLPADAAHRAYARIDATARHLAALPEETRTLPQLRADITADLITGDGTPDAVRAVVNVTVPVLTLLNHHNDKNGQDRQNGQDGQDGQEQQHDGQDRQDGDDRRAPQPLLNLTPAGAQPRIDPAILEGYGPIDDDTARRLTGTASTLYRILVDPVDGAVITVDRKKYRPPADLKRLVTARFATCSFPGCNRPAPTCDIDHTDPWELGGPTAVTNLAPLCRRDHRLKHNTAWHMTRTPTTGTITFTSPRGSTHDTDPPPF